jgi:hypothetical protein
MNSLQQRPEVRLRGLRAVVAAVSNRQSREIPTRGGPDDARGVLPARTGGMASTSNPRCEMKKMTLNVEALGVESFNASPEAEFLGDVAMTRPQVCDPFTMGPHCP